MIFIALLVVYLWCAPATVVFEDDGLFILAAWFNGTAHPPGYPLYTLLGHLFSWLPLGSAAWRLHAMSALFGALCGVCVYRLVREWIGDGRGPAVLGGLGFGFSGIFWSQAIIAEVYTLNVLIILVLALIAGRLARGAYGKDADFRHLALLAFLYGLGLSNHWPLLVLSTPLLIAILWPRLPALFPRLPRALPFLILGLFPYAWMVYRSQQDPVISFYGPVTSWHDFWYYVGRQGYAGIDSSPTADLVDKGRFTLYFIRQFFLQYSPAAAPVIALGFLYQGRLLPRRLQAGLLLLLMGNSFVLILLLNFDYDEFHRDIFRVYPLLAYVTAALYLTCGMCILEAWLKRLLRNGRAATHMISAGCAVLLAAVFITNLSSNLRQGDEFARNFAAVILDNLARGSTLFLNGDLYTGPVGYLNLVGGYRGDVTLNHVRGRFFATRLIDPLGNDYASAKQTYDEFISGTPAGVYYTFGLPHDYGVRDYGIFRQVLRNRPSGYREAAVPRGLRDLIVSARSSVAAHDPWGQMALKKINLGYCHELFVGGTASGDLAGWLSQPDHDVNTLCDTFHARMDLIDVLLGEPHPDLDFIQALAEQCLEETGQAIFRGEAAMPYYYLGVIEQRRGDGTAAVKYYEKSAALWHDVKNPSLQKLASMSSH